MCSVEEDELLRPRALVTVAAFGLLLLAPFEAHVPDAEAVAPPSRLSSVDSVGSVGARDVAVAGTYAYLVTGNNTGSNPEL